MWSLIIGGLFVKDMRTTNIDATVIFSTQTSKFPVSIKAPVGELLQGCPMTEADFLAKQGLYLTSRFHLAIPLNIL